MFRARTPPPPTHAHTQTFSQILPYSFYYFLFFFTSMRKKVKLAFIVNDSARKISYNKRKKSLMKKIDELTTLCGIDACAIVYSDFDPQPEVWPSPWEVQRIITKFKTYSEFEQGRKMLDQESFLKQRIVKAKEQLAKVNKNNREMEMSLLLFQCLSKENFMDNMMSMVVLNDVAWVINEKMEEIRCKMEELERVASTTTQSQAQVVEADGRCQLP